MSENGEKQLPSGWREAPLGDLLTVLRGVSYKKQDATTEPAPGKIPILRATNIAAGLNFEDLVYVPQEYVSEVQLLNLGDMVIAASSGSRHVVGKAAALTVPWVGSFGAFCYGLRPYLQETASYISLFLQTSTYRDYVSALSAGVNINNLRREHIEGTPLPVPPLNEQHRIVAKIEELFSELDKGVESLKTARAKLNVYRQAVLKHAFEGKLTAQWREENKDKLETPEQLLARIKQEREAHYERQLQEWKAAVKKCEGSGKSGKKPAEPKKPLELADVPQDVIAKLPHLSEGWLWAHLGDISDVSGGLTKNQKRNSLPRKMKYLRVANVYADEILTDDIHEIGVTDSEAKAVALEAGDLLIVEGNGSIGQIGRVALWDGELSLCGHQNHLIRTRLLKNFLPRFFLQFLLSPLGRDLIVREASSTSGLHTLSISKVSNLVVPVASSAEESAVVAQIEERLPKVDKTLEDIDTQLVMSEALRQSILKKAFAGQLVEQDPDDEPASVLLDRIRAEREKAEKNNHSKKTKKRKTTA